LSMQESLLKDRIGKDRKSKMTSDAARSEIWKQESHPKI